MSEEKEFLPKGCVNQYGEVCGDKGCRDWVNCLKVQNKELEINEAMKEAKQALAEFRAVKEGK